MASVSQSRILFLLAIVVSLLSISATARPCKTFLVSSYSISFQNPNDPSASSAGFVTVFTEIHQVNPRPAYLRLLPGAIPERPIQRPHSFYHDFGSLRDRTKDILSVVVALLFGGGCGALTAAILYLGWSLFSHRYSFDEESDVEDELSPKKMGYLKIPADTQKEAA